MTQHRGSLKKIFIHNSYKSKNKSNVDNYNLVLNLKKKCFCFLRQTNNESKYLKKPKEGFVKKVSFILNRLLVDFTILIIQKAVKKSFVLCKYSIKKARSVLKNTDVFVKNSIYIFSPQHYLKAQQK